MRVEISRAKWGRGQPIGSALKRGDDGKMCCLGFVCVAAGVPEEKLVNVGYPGNLFMPRIIKATGMVSGGNTMAGPMYGEPVPEALQPLIGGRFDNPGSSGSDERVLKMARVNDGTEFSESEREDRLTEMAKGFGLEFVFVD